MSDINDQRKPGYEEYQLFFSHLLSENSDSDGEVSSDKWIKIHVALIEAIETRWPNLTHCLSWNRSELVREVKNALMGKQYGG